MHHAPQTPQPSQCALPAGVYFGVAFPANMSPQTQSKKKRRRIAASRLAIVATSPANGGTRAGARPFPSCRCRNSRRSAGAIEHEREIKADGFPESDHNIVAVYHAEKSGTTHTSIHATHLLGIVVSVVTCARVISGVNGRLISSLSSRRIHRLVAR